MDETPPLPDLHQSEVTAATLNQLFQDVGTHAEIIEIIPKHAPGYVEETPKMLQLDEAHALLALGKVRGLQLRYRYQEQIWWDTILPLPGGLFRIVRISHNFG